MPEAEWTARSAPKPASDRRLVRKIIAEPVFGQIKAIRGLDRFLLRGTEKTFGELNLIAITHNLLKLHRAGLNTA